MTFNGVSTVLERSEILGEMAGNILGGHGKAMQANFCVAWTFQLPNWLDSPRCRAEFI